MFVILQINRFLNYEPVQVTVLETITIYGPMEKHIMQ